MNTIQSWILLTVLITTIVCAAGWRRERCARCRLSADEESLSSNLKAILSSLSSGLLLLDARGVIRTVSRSACRILGSEAGSLVGRDANEALDEGWHEFTRCLIQALVREESAEREEVRVQLRDGRTMPVGITVNPIYDRVGRLDGAVAVFQDLTQVMHMRERMRESDRLAAVGELAASIAHEIRNPLGSIRGSAELLVAELDLEGTEQRLLELILKESGRVNGLITDFLSYARLRPAVPQLVDIHSFFDDIALQVSVQGQGDGEAVDITTVVEPVDLVLMFDEEQIRQVLLNLVINAKAAIGGQGAVTIAAGLNLEAGRCIMTVTDTGPGIAPSLLTEIFKPFVTTRKQGTGLGLATVQRIMHAHGGSVTAANLPEGGAVFTLSLPLVHTDPCLDPDDMLGEASTSCVLT